MKLRIAITRREYLTNLDGINRFVFTLADGLRSLGHEVHVLSYSFSSKSGSKLHAYLKRFFDVEKDIKVHALTTDLETETWPKIALTWLWKGSSLLKKLDVHVVILNGIVPLRTGALRIAVNHGLSPGALVQAKGFKRFVYFQSAKYLYKYGTDLVVCDSSKLGKEFINTIGIDCTVIHLPIKLHLFRPENVSRRDPLVVHVGTRPWKNVELSIRSVKTLIENMGVDAKLFIVGSKTTQIGKLISKYKDIIPRHLDFVFDADISVIRELLSRARALILPSRYESSPYVVLEAFASGLPVVVSEAVPSEVVSDGYNGFRVRGFEPDQYASRLASLLTDDSLWKDISRNDLKTANDYSHMKIARDYESVFTRLVEREKTPEKLLMKGG